MLAISSLIQRNLGKIINNKFLMLYYVSFHYIKVLSVPYALSYFLGSHFHAMRGDRVKNVQFLHDFT